MTPMPADLAEFLGMKTQPRPAAPHSMPVGAVKVTKEGGLWSVYVHGQEAGWVDRSDFAGGFRALTKRGTVGHCHSLDSAVNFVIENHH